jgi:hypothetical protein
MIKPTVGRVVWFYPPVDDGRDPNGQPLAAMIAKVIDDRHINIGALFGDGTPFAVQDVVLVQEGDQVDPDQAHACWMPYQVGQAAKAEKLELQLAGSGESKDQPTGAELTKRLTNFAAPPIVPLPWGADPAASATADGQKAPGPALNGTTAGAGTLQLTDALSAAVAVAPRVALADIEAAIAVRHDTTADMALQVVAVGDEAPLRLLSVCFLVMKNGFTIIGKSAPASAENFNAEIGKQYAYEDAVRQVWPLMGFALRDKLVADQLARQGQKNTG